MNATQNTMVSHIVMNVVVTNMVLKIIFAMTMENAPANQTTVVTSVINAAKTTMTSQIVRNVIVLKKELIAATWTMDSAIADLVIMVTNVRTRDVMKMI